MQRPESCSKWFLHHSDKSHVENNQLPQCSDNTLHFLWGKQIRKQPGGQQMILWGHCGAGRKISKMSKDPAFEDGQLLIWNHTSVTVKKNLSRGFRSCLEWGGKAFSCKALHQCTCVLKNKKNSFFPHLEHLTHCSFRAFLIEACPKYKIEKKPTCWSR